MAELLKARLSLLHLTRNCREKLRSWANLASCPDSRYFVSAKGKMTLHMSAEHSIAATP